MDSAQDFGTWEGWGSSLAWWARAIGGTANADYYADLIYTTNMTDGLPGLGLNIVRYNIGGGGINQPQENKGAKLQWQMDIHGYWTNPNDTDPAKWNWSADQNQRALLKKAQARGANIFQMFSDSPMWWMNSNHSTAGSDTGGDCLDPTEYDRFARYLAAVARYSADNWGIRFDSIEAFNEPSADWWKQPGRQEGCHFEILTQQKVAQSLRRALDEVHLNNTSVAAADENNIDAALSTWRAYDSATRAVVGQVNVHGYSNGTEPYRGPNRVELRRAIEAKRVWQSEYGDGDASGYMMAQSIIRDIKDLRPSAWIYWQPVEPDVSQYGWGLINANYIDTHDQLSDEKTPMVRVNRKFFVYGQFTRYVRQGYHFIAIDDPSSVAAYDGSSHQLVIIKVTGDAEEAVQFDLSRFTQTWGSVQVIATTTTPAGKVPDWRQHKKDLTVEMRGGRKLVEANLYPKSVYTFLIREVLP